MSEELEGEPEEGAAEEEPEAKRVQKPMKAEWATIAQAFADPESPTYQDKIESYFAGYPPHRPEDRQDPAKREYARKRFYLLLDDDRFQDALQILRIRVRGAAQFTRNDYFTLLLQREQLFALRGGKGDAQASAAALKLIGQSAGFLVTRTEDVTPPERAAQRDASTVERLILMAERLKRLREPAEAPVKVIEAGQLEVVPVDSLPTSQ